MRTLAPTCWGEHLTARERMAVDEMLSHLRKPNEQAVAVEVRRLRDGTFQVFAIRREELSRR